MINKAQHKIITKVMEMLDGLDDEDFENSNFFIDVRLQDRYGEFEIVFEDGAGDWTYRIEQL